MSLKEGIEKRIQALVLEGVDIIFVKERHLFDRINQIKMHIPNVKKAIQVMLVDDFDDLKALSHQDMRMLGWVREEKLTVKDAVKVLDSKGFDVQMPEEKV